MVKDVNVFWNFVQLADNPGGTVLKHVQPSFSADGGVNFVPLDPVVPPDNRFLIQQLDVGLYIVRLDVIDVGDAITQTVDTPFEVPDESVPSQIIDVQVTLT